ncbi:MAG TPA: hypothetical protein ENN73_05610, partial [Firmicutes bacterium]|nr:hypothetical protein [Bacillota bacterium]
MKDLIQSRLRDDPLISRFRSLFSGLDVYLVGGYLPSFMMAKVSNDFDFIYRASEQEKVFGIISSEFKKEPFLMGRGHPENTYRVSTGLGIIDLTELNGSLEDNLIKRDLTINSIAVRLSDLEIIDPVNGLDDFAGRRLAFNSEESVAADPVRILRLFRMYSRFPEFNPEDKSLDLAKRYSDKLSDTASERVGFEIKELFSGKGFLKAFKLLTEYGITERVFRVFYSGYLSNVTAVSVFRYFEVLDRYITENVFEFSLMPDDRAALRFLVMFDSIFKLSDIPFTDIKAQKDYYAKVSDFLKPMNIPVVIKNPILNIGSHRNDIIKIYHKSKPSLFRISRLFRNYGDNLKLLIIFSCVVFEVEHLPSEGEPNDFIVYCREIYDEYKNSRYIASPDLVTGGDLLELGYEEGPEIGRALYLIGKKTDDGYIKDYNEALDYANDILHYRNSPTKKYRIFSYISIVLLCFLIIFSYRILLSEVYFSQVLDMMNVKRVHFSGVDEPIAKLEKAAKLFPLDYRFYSMLGDCYEIQFFLGKKS